jgi:hypothetical protein
VEAVSVHDGGAKNASVKETEVEREIARKKKKNVSEKGIERRKKRKHVNARVVVAVVVVSGRDEIEVMNEVEALLADPAREAKKKGGEPLLLCTLRKQ